MLQDIKYDKCLVRWLRERGSDLLLRDYDGNSLLHLVDYGAGRCDDSSDEEDDGVVDNRIDDRLGLVAYREQLIVGTANQMTRSQRNALMILSYLLEQDVLDPNCTNDSGDTPAHSCVSQSDDPGFTFRALLLLRQKHANLNARNNEGVTVGMNIATNYGGGPIYDWCISDESSGGGGCDPDTLDNSGRSMRDHAITADPTQMDAL